MKWLHLLGVHSCLNYWALEDTLILRVRVSSMELNVSEGLCYVADMVDILYWIRDLYRLRLINWVCEYTWAKWRHHHHLSLLGSFLKCHARYRLCWRPIILLFSHILWNISSTASKISIRLTDQRTFEETCAPDCGWTIEETIALCLQLNIVIWSILVVLAYILTNPNLIRDIEIVSRLDKRNFKLNFIDEIKVHILA